MSMITTHHIMKNGESKFTGYIHDDDNELVAESHDPKEFQKALENFFDKEKAALEAKKEEKEPDECKCGGNGECAECKCNQKADEEADQCEKEWEIEDFSDEEMEQLIAGLKQFEDPCIRVIDVPLLNVFAAAFAGFAASRLLRSMFRRFW